MLLLWSLCRRSIGFFHFPLPLDSLLYNFSLCLFPPFSSQREKQRPDIDGEGKDRDSLAMRTRRGLCYPRVGCGGGRDVFLFSEKSEVVKRRRDFAGEHMVCRKRKRNSLAIAGKSDLFDALPDDLVISILCKLSSTAGCPSDFINVLITYALLYIPLFSFPSSLFGFLFPGK